jgi:hypothetical protein
MDSQIVSFSTAIAEHEDRIADLVLSICARAFGGGADMSSMQKTISEMLDGGGFDCDPMDLINQKDMEVRLIDERVLCDSLSVRLKRYVPSAEMERLLFDHGWDRVQGAKRVRVRNRRGNTRPISVALFAPRYDVVHRMKGRRLLRELVKAAVTQEADSKVLALEYHLWHFRKMLERMVDEKIA